MIQDRKLECPECPNTGDEHGGFAAIGSALVLAYLNEDGECTDYKDPELDLEAGFREVLCEECNAELGDLPGLDPTAEDGSAPGSPQRSSGERAPFLARLPGALLRDGSAAATNVHYRLAFLSGFSTGVLFTLAVLLVSRGC